MPVPRSEPGDVPTGFLDRLLRGELSREAVVDYVIQLWFLHTALEGAICRASATSQVACLHDCRLERVNALEQDLDDLCGKGWRGRLSMLPATADYVSHLERLTDSDGLRVIAHHRARYLPFVREGCFMAGTLARRYGFVEKRGLSFLDFSTLGGAHTFCGHYRERLAGLALDARQRATLHTETIEAAEFSMALNDALGECH